MTSYDPFSPETLDDPFPAYAGLREACPAHRFAEFQPPFFTLSRYDDVRDAMSDPTIWSIRYGQSPQYTRPSGLVNDPPEHTAFRHLFSRAFTPKTVARLADDIENLGLEFIGRMSERSEGDFHDLYACPLPTIVIARLLGIPPSDLTLFKQMSGDLTATYNEPDPNRSAAPRAAFDAYFGNIIRARRTILDDAGISHPGPEHLGPVLPDDLISSFLIADLDGRRLTDHELQWMLLLLLLGGNETSTALLTNLLWRLLQDRSRWDAVHADSSLIDVAVEESLRHDPPVLGLFRTPTRDVSIHGVTIPQKAKVMVCFGSANHDAGVFSDPEQYRLDRPLDETKRHLTFGFGAHYCPGAALARLEARISLRLLLEHLPDLRLNGCPERIVPFNLWGRRFLPVAW